VDRTCHTDGQQPSAHGQRSRSGQRKQYNDALEDNLAVIHINSAELEGQATDRTSLCAFCRQWVDSFDDSRMCLTRNRPRLRKTARQARPAHPLCRRTCSWQRLQDRILLWQAHTSVTRDPSRRRFSPSVSRVRKIREALLEANQCHARWVK